MPIGTNTIAESTLSADTKHALGRRDRDGGHSDHCHPGGTSAFVIPSSSAHFAVEGGRILPQPGHEQSWIAGS